MAQNDHPPMPSLLPPRTALGLRSSSSVTGVLLRWSMTLCLALACVFELRSCNFLPKVPKATGKKWLARAPVSNAHRACPSPTTRRTAPPALLSQLLQAGVGKAQRHQQLLSALLDFALFLFVRLSQRLRNARGEGGW